MGNSGLGSDHVFAQNHMKFLNMQQFRKRSYLYAALWNLQVHGVHCLVYCSPMNTLLVEISVLCSLQFSLQ